MLIMHEKTTTLPDYDIFSTRRWLHGIIILPDKRILAGKVEIPGYNDTPWEISVGIQTMRIKNTIQDDIEFLSTMTVRRLGFSLSGMKDVDIHHIASHKPIGGIGFLYQHNVVMEIYRIRILEPVTVKVSKSCEVRGFDSEYLLSSTDKEIRCDPRSREALNVFSGLNITV